jgi:hypothetical protein
MGDQRIRLLDKIGNMSETNKMRFVGLVATLANGLAPLGLVA